MKNRDLVPMVVLFVSTCAIAQSSMEFEAKKQAVCGDYGRKAEAIWRTKSTKNVEDLNLEFDLDQNVAEAMLSKDGFVKTGKDAYTRGYAMCIDYIRVEADKKARGYR